MKLHIQISAVTANLVLLLAVLIRADLNSDSRALLDFANSVPHVRKLNWDQRVDSICTSWIGVTCTEDKSRVDEIHLPGFGLFGPIPANTLSRLDALRVLSLRSNYLNGTLPEDILSIPSLQFIFLQNNNISGDLPLNLSPRLSMIDLSFNSFSGEIPSEIGRLERLSVLNLHFNSFSGAIPEFDLPRLKGLNLSHNSLNGSVPDSLRMFPVSAFEGNDHLCGLPLDSCSYSPLPEKSSYDSRKLSLRAIISIAIAGASFIVLTLLAVLFFCLRNKTNGETTLIIAKGTSNVGKTEDLKSDDFGSGVQASEKNKLVFFEGCSSSFDLEDLLRASAEVLGKGSYGTAYKAILDESTTVVVKRLKDLGIAKKEFEQQMETVNELGRHQNVVPLLAYYFSKDEKLLVYEYMSCGSLSAALHGNRGTGRTPLDWESRLNISLGAARGLAHIHLKDGAKCVHGNIKSSNVLLSSTLESRISDFGLSLMLSFGPAKCRYPGYRAPEVIESRKVSQKGDVYSFGVVLLEMLTGKSPIQGSGHDDVIDLPRWVRSVVREEWTAEVFDVELTKGTGNVEEEMVQMLQIGLACVAKVVDLRPRMDEVVRMIEDVRPENGSSKGSNVATPSPSSF